MDLHVRINKTSAKIGQLSRFNRLSEFPTNIGTDISLSLLYHTFHDKSSTYLHSLHPEIQAVRKKFPPGRAFPESVSL